jgi:hypothetical protein
MDGLLGLKVGDAIDVNRRTGSINAAVYRLRKRFDSPIRVIARTLTPGTCRVWRIE